MISQLVSFIMFPNCLEILMPSTLIPRYNKISYKQVQTKAALASLYTEPTGGGGGGGGWGSVVAVV